MKLQDFPKFDPEILQGNHGLSVLGGLGGLDGLAGLKHCLEVSPEPPNNNKRICGPVRRIPCRARSLSNKHNSETAFFDIPRDAPHGMLLNCSHEECIKSGRRFRYCQVCELPVAKRNFVKRHGHDMVNSAKELRDTVDRILPLPSSKGFKSVPPSGDESDESVGFHEMSSDDDMYGEEVNVEPCMEPYNVARAVSFDETKHAVENPLKDVYLQLGTNEELWLPTILPEPQSTCSVEDFEPIDVAFQQQLQLPRQQQQQQLPLYNHVPPSPPTQPCTVSTPSVESFLETYSRVVPLVQPGETITVTEFEEAIYGIDFSSVFD